MAEGLLRIGEVAARAGVTSRTVDFYTSLGLLTPAARTKGSFRLYDPSAVERIGAIRQLEAFGVPLNEIGQALNDRQNPDVAPMLDQLKNDLQALQAAAATAGPEATGLLAAVTARVHNLITAVVEVTAGLPPPA